MTEETDNIKVDMDFFPLGDPASGDGILNEDGSGDFLLLEGGDFILLEGAAAATPEFRRRLIIAS